MKYKDKLPPKQWNTDPSIFKDEFKKKVMDKILHNKNYILGKNLLITQL